MGTRVLAAGGLGAALAALAGVALAVLPDPPGRLAYRSIVANAAAPRLGLLAGLGGALAVPAMVSGEARGLAVATLALAGLAAGIALALMAPALRSARARGLRLSVRRAVLDSGPMSGAVRSWRRALA
ncbi:MAG: hypothetical protein JO023_01285, partial [Chloroflexi bacterium]|nr:hypothetical protein [Chloroflexota bacterium]